MLTENHDFNEIYERYKNLVLKVRICIRTIMKWRKTLHRKHF